MDVHLQSQGSAESLIAARHVPALPLEGKRSNSASSPLGQPSLARSQTARSAQPTKVGHSAQHARTLMYRTAPSWHVQVLLTSKCTSRQYSRTHVLQAARLADASRPICPVCCMVQLCPPLLNIIHSYSEPDYADGCAGVPTHSPATPEAHHLR